MFFNVLYGTVSWCIDDFKHWICDSSWWFGCHNYFPLQQIITSGWVKCRCYGSCSINATFVDVSREICYHVKTQLYYFKWVRCSCYGWLLLYKWNFCVYSYGLQIEWNVVAFMEFTSREICYILNPNFIDFTNIDNKHHLRRPNVNLGYPKLALGRRRCCFF